MVTGNHSSSGEGGNGHESRDPQPAASAPESGDERLRLLSGVWEASTEHSIVAVDREGAIELWNEGAHRLYGYTPEEIIGRPLAVLHTPEDVEAGLPARILRQSLEAGEWEGTIERVRKDGSRFTARVVKTVRRDASGQPVGLLIISSDISDELRLTKQLETARSYAQSLLESAPDAMVIVDVSGVISLVNAETETLFGYTREELIGQRVEMLMPARYHGHHTGHRQGFFASPRSRPMGAGLDLWGVRKDGDEFPVEISLSPLRTEDGVQVTAAIRDVTQRKRDELALRDANAQLEAANLAKDNFLASMSHELRTPLNAILGFTGTLLMELPGPLNAEQSKQLRTVQTNGRHLLSIINDLLDLAKIESGKVELHMEQVECRALLEETAAGLSSLAEEKGLALELRLPRNEVMVCSDRRVISQILINLVNNAIKFTESGVVGIELTVPGAPASEVRVTVSDTGPGIHPEDQDRLFAAFEQLDHGTARQEGTGLGLYICRRLCELIDARITFESELGQGSRFTLRLAPGQ